MFSPSSRRLFHASAQARVSHALRQISDRATFVSTTTRLSPSTTSTSFLGFLFVIGSAASFAVAGEEGYPALSSIPTTALDSRIPLGGDVINSGIPVKEPSTGILFSQLCNGMFLTGCGVRIKWGLVKVYAVGTYMDPLAMSALKHPHTKPSDLQKALLDPNYPRTIRIVMARGLSSQKFTSAIVEALEPRMKGQDLDKLDEFKKLNPPLDLVKGAEIEMTIRGDMLLYKNATGGLGTIRSRVFTEALCDVYYGEEAVSPSHKDAVLSGIPKL